MQKIQIKNFLYLLTCILFIITTLSLANELPKDIVWLTNDTDPEYSSDQATKGGTYTTYIESFPPTIRVVGPDSNNSFRSFILDNQFSLIGIHPNTENIIPQIATHWAFDKDGKTMYFKINPKARWSDGTPVTADDFLFTLEFMRSKYIVAPWYNDYYTKEIDKVIKYDDYTIAVVSTKKQPDLHLVCALAPTPKHYYKKLTPDFVTKYNWAIVPNTGPYQITKIEKGKYIEFSRKKDWWANDLRYYRNRFNVDKVIIKVIRDKNVAWEYFKKGELDSFEISYPEYWHDKAKGPEFDKGYIHKLWFYTDTPQPSMGLWINQDHPLLKDINVRLGLQHSINMDKVLNTILRGDYMRLPQHYTGYGKYTNPNIKAREFDLKKAEEYFKLAGFDKKGSDGIRVRNDGQRLSFVITYGVDAHTPRLVILKEEAKKAGVELKLELLDLTAAYKKVMGKKHELSWMAWSVGLRPAFWEHYHSINAHKPQTNNITNTDDKELDKLIDAYRDATDESEKIKLSHIIQQKVHDKAVFIPAYMLPFFRVAYWRWCKLPKIPATKWSEDAFYERGFGPETGGLFWIDEKLKKQTLEAKKKSQSFEPVVIIDTTFKKKS